MGDALSGDVVICRSCNIIIRIDSMTMPSCAKCHHLNVLPHPVGIRTFGCVKLSIVKLCYVVLCSVVDVYLVWGA